MTLKLPPEQNQAALVWLNFIKSKLTVDTLNDGSRDVDLVSKEIVIADTRFVDEPVNKISNVFTSI